MSPSSGAGGVVRALAAGEHEHQLVAVLVQHQKRAGLGVGGVHGVVEDGAEQLHDLAVGAWRLDGVHQVLERVQELAQDLYLAAQAVVLGAELDHFVLDAELFGHVSRPVRDDARRGVPKLPNPSRTPRAP